VGLRQLSRYFTLTLQTGMLMKKIVSVLFAILAVVFFCNNTIAKNIDADKPLTMMQPLKAGASIAECAAYPTCITISNLSSNEIYIDVPSLFFSRVLYPTYMQPIIANDYSSKQVILRDWLGYTFYNAYVPNHYDLVVYDNFGKAAVKSK
jgi:hypothetical protein